jgi:hypothetical protein
MRHVVHMPRGQMFCLARLGRIASRRRGHWYASLVPARPNLYRPRLCRSRLRRSTLSRSSTPLRCVGSGQRQHRGENEDEPKQKSQSGFHGSLLSSRKSVGLRDRE